MQPCKGWGSSQNVITSSLCAVTYRSCRKLHLVYTELFGITYSQTHRKTVSIALFPSLSGTTKCTADYGSRIRDTYGETQLNSGVDPSRSLGNPVPTDKEYPGVDSVLVWQYRPQTQVKKAIIALYHNIRCTNAHNKQKLWETSALVSPPLQIWGTSPPVPVGIDAHVGVRNTALLSF